MPALPDPHHGASDLSEAARQRLDALRRDLLREAGVPEETEAGLSILSGDSAAPLQAADTEIPRPGRHASRRPRERSRLLLEVAERLPAAIADRPLGTPHVAVVAVFALVLVTGGAWWALQLRGDRPDVAVAAPVGGPGAGGGAVGGAPARSTGQAVSPAPSSPAPLTSLTSTGPGSVDGEPEGRMVVVDVAGRVRRPGLASLPAGSRVADAIEAAGGARRGVRLVSLNLARVLADGEQVLVGVRPVPGAAAGVPTSAAAAGDAAGTVLVNINAADQTALETLPGVGPVTAAAIIAWRTEHGGFTSVEELIEVSGIGPATLEELLPHVTV